jgi:hypothetical protein
MKSCEKKRLLTLTVKDTENMEKVDKSNSVASVFPEILGENLAAIDEVSQKQNVPIPDRPPAALHKLLLFDVITEIGGRALSVEPDGRSQVSVTSAFDQGL